MVIPTSLDCYLYHNVRVSSRDAKILARGESPISGGEATPGPRSAEGRLGRLNYSASVRTGSYIFWLRLRRAETMAIPVVPLRHLLP